MPYLTANQSRTMSLPGDIRCAPMAVIFGGNLQQRMQFIDQLHKLLAAKGKSVTKAYGSEIVQLFDNPDVTNQIHIQLMDALASGEVLLLDLGDKEPEGDDDDICPLWRVFNERYPDLPFTYMDFREIDLDGPFFQDRTLDMWVDIILDPSPF